MTKKPRHNPKYKPGDKLLFIDKYPCEVIRWDVQYQEYVIAAFGDECWVQEKDLSERK